MGKTRRMISPLSILTVLIVAAISLSVFYTTRNSVASENLSLLKSQAEQESQLFGTDVNLVTTKLPATLAVAEATGFSAAAFKAEVAPLAGVTSDSSVAIVKDDRILLAAGIGFKVGRQGG